LLLKTKSRSRLHAEDDLICASSCIEQDFRAGTRAPEARSWTFCLEQELKLIIRRSRSSV